MLWRARRRSGGRRKTRWRMAQWVERCQAKTGEGVVPGASDWPGAGKGTTRGEPGRTTPFGEIGLGGYAALEAGGLWACAGHRPRWVRIFSMAAAWSMKAMIRVEPPHRGQSGGSAS